MNFAAVVGLCSVWAMPFLRNNLQRHKRNQSAEDPLIEGETLFRVGHPPLASSCRIAIMTWQHRSPRGPLSGSSLLSMGRDLLCGQPEVELSGDQIDHGLEVSCRPIA